MPTATDDLIKTLNRARARLGLSQRELSARVGVPQAAISRIESRITDLRLSSLTELARALDHELVLVPRKLLPAVEAIVRNPSSAPTKEQQTRSQIIFQLQEAIKNLIGRTEHDDDLGRLAKTLKELSHVSLTRSEIERVRKTMQPVIRPRGSYDRKVINRSVEDLRELRNRIVHRPDEPTRPAYALDKDDDDA